MLQDFLYFDILFFPILQVTEIRKKFTCINHMLDINTHTHIYTYKLFKFQIYMCSLCHSLCPCGPCCGTRKTHIRHLRLSNLLLIIFFFNSRDFLRFSKHNLRMAPIVYRLVETALIGIFLRSLILLKSKLLPSAAILFSQITKGIKCCL